MSAITFTETAPPPPSPTVGRRKLLRAASQKVIDQNSAVHAVFAILGAAHATLGMAGPDADLTEVRENMDKLAAALGKRTRLSYKLDGFMSESFKEQTLDPQIMLYNDDPWGSKVPGKGQSLLWAAQTGKTLRVIELVGQAHGMNPNVKMERDAGGQGPLHVACMRGHQEVVDLLLAAGADMKSKDVWGYTPLHCAARWGHEGVVVRLLRHGANVHARTQSQHFTPAQLAQKFDDNELAETSGSTRASDNKTHKQRKQEVLAMLAQWAEAETV